MNLLVFLFYAAIDTATLAFFTLLMLVQHQ